MTNDAIELKDCPFCGRAAHKTERFCKADCPDAAAHFLHGVSCNSLGCASIRNYYDKDEALKAWNASAATTPPITPEVRERCVAAVERIIEIEFQKTKMSGILPTDREAAEFTCDAVLRELNVSVGRE